MSLLIITNNHKIKDFALEKKLDVIFVEGDAKETLFMVRKKLLNGWRLAIDPLAGYLSRPNPFHTVVVQENCTGEVIGDDIIRIEYAISQWNRYEHILPMTPKLEADYRELDFSLGVSSIDGSLRTPAYYKCF